MGEVDRNLSRALELAHKTPDMVAQRAAVLALIDPRPGEDALDVGSGNGCLACELAARVGPSGSVRGVDPSQTMLALATHRGHHLRRREHLHRRGRARRGLPPRRPRGRRDRRRSISGKVMPLRSRSRWAGTGPRGGREPPPVDGPAPIESRPVARRPHQRPDDDLANLGDPGNGAADDDPYPNLHGGYYGLQGYSPAALDRADQLLDGDTLVPVERAGDPCGGRCRWTLSPDAPLSEWLLAAVAAASPCRLDVAFPYFARCDGPVDWPSLVGEHPQVLRPDEVTLRANDGASWAGIVAAYRYLAALGHQPRLDVMLSITPDDRVGLEPMGLIADAPTSSLTSAHVDNLLADAGRPRELLHHGDRDCAAGEPEPCCPGLSRFARNRSFELGLGCDSALPCLTTQRAVQPHVTPS